MDRRWQLRTSIRASEVPLPLASVWRIVASGEDRPQWYVDALPWAVRGGLDRLTGGAGRRWDPPGRELLKAGDTAGFWRVLECDAAPTKRARKRRLVLRADVRAPGAVTWRVTATPTSPTSTRVEQAVTFTPSGLLGTTYLLLDLPAREVVMELAQRRLMKSLGQAAFRA